MTDAAERMRALIVEARTKNSVMEGAAEVFESVADMLAKPGLTPTEARRVSKALSTYADDLAGAIARGTAADHELED